MTRFLVFFGTVLALGAQTDEGRGAAAYIAGRYGEAQAILEAEIEMKTATPRTHFWLAYTYLAVGQRDKAISHFEKYLETNPRDEDCLYALARTYAQLSEISLMQIFSLDPASAASYRMRGIRFELEKSWKEAIEQYETAAKLDPKAHGIQASMGRIWEKELKDTRRALAAYQAELKVNPYSREANQFFAARYRALKQPTRARRYERIVKVCYNDASATCPMPKPSGDAGLGRSLVEGSRPEEALPHLLSWRSNEPQNPDAYYYLGEAFTDLKVRTIQRLRDANPNSYRLHQILAEGYASYHQKSQAVAEYRKVLELQPDTPGVRYELARLLSDTDTSEATALLEKELTMDPGHYMARALLGRIYVVLRQPERGVPLLEEAMSVKPDIVDAQKALGQGYSMRREFRRALPLLQAVAEARPLDEHIHFLLSQAYRGVGQPEEAAREMKLHQETLRKITGPVKTTAPE
jgi:tetratricopeptide (TPR) repeat protein